MKALPKYFRFTPIRTLGILLFIWFLSLEALAQHVEITPFTGYTFNHGFPIFGGRAKLGGGQTFGGMIGIPLGNSMEIETSYSFQSGTTTANSTAIRNDVSVKTNVHYILIGANRLFPTSSQITLFSGAKIGAGIVGFPSNEFDAISRLAVGLNGGMKYMASEKVGIRLQANLMMPINNVGGNLWWSPGSGTSVWVSGWSSVIQFGFTGGLIFRL